MNATAARHEVPGSGTLLGHSPGRGQHQTGPRERSAHARTNGGSSSRPADPPLYVDLRHRGPVGGGALSLSPLQVISGPSPFADCDISQMGAGGVNFLDSEVEPWVEVNPTNPDNVVAVWQQDRWSNGGARGLLTAFTDDGGATWGTTFPHFSICAGGTEANGGNYERSSDPWVSFSPNGVAHQISLSVNFINDPVTAILVSRSADGGETWSEPITVARDPSAERRSCSTTRSR